jgi:pimeloyl-ACP methyl ester carboxylesterase
MSSGVEGVILSALEPRLKTSVLAGAGLWGDVPPEVDSLNFAPRVRIPTLMLNGLYDFGAPVETAQRPLFARLGTPAEHKRHKVFEAGHTVPIEYLAGEVLPWLDRYLGQVVSSAEVPRLSTASGPSR